MDVGGSSQINNSPQELTKRGLFGNSFEKSIITFFLYLHSLDKAPDIPDDLLLAAIARGDEKAFNALFARYRNRLYSYFVKCIKSTQAAEELVLDVFVKIWTARS